MKKYKALIFDLDGTIIDTESIWHKATNALISQRNIPYEEIEKSEIHQKIHGLALHKSCALIKETFQFNDPLEQLMYEKSQHAYSLYKTEITFIEGFEAFHIQANKYFPKTGIATNADDTTLEIVIESLNLKQFFSNHIYGISQVNNICKPEPDIYLHVAEQLEVDPSECIAIEDSAHGITAAQNAGMFCIGINTKKNKNHLSHADQVIDYYHEINLAEFY